MIEKYKNIDNVDVVVEKNNNIEHYWVLVKTMQYDSILMENLWNIAKEIQIENPDKKYSFAYIPFFDKKTKNEAIEDWKSIVETCL